MNIKNRESGIELMKIIAILMIILFHSIDTLGNTHLELGNEFNNVF